MDSKEQDRLTLVEVQVAKIETKLDIVTHNLLFIYRTILHLLKTQWWLFSTLVGCLSVLFQFFFFFFFFHLILICPNCPKSIPQLVIVVRVTPHRLFLFPILNGRCS